MESAELRMRIIEALTRSGSINALQNTSNFLQRVAEIETFVIASAPTTQPEPEPPQAQPAPAKLKRGKAAGLDKSDASFLE